MTNGGGSFGNAETGATFAVEDEDHTLANALRFMLNKKCAAAQCLHPVAFRQLA